MCYYIGSRKSLTVTDQGVALPWSLKPLESALHVSHKLLASSFILLHFKTISLMNVPVMQSSLSYLMKKCRAFYHHMIYDPMWGDLAQGSGNRSVGRIKYKDRYISKDTLVSHVFSCPVIFWWHCSLQYHSVVERFTFAIISPKAREDENQAFKKELCNNIFFH